MIDKSACLVKTSWSTDKEPLLMDSGLELFLFCPFPYVSSTCLLCMNIHSCNDGFVLCSLAKRKQGFTSQDTLRTLLKAPSVFAIAVFLGWSVKMVRSCLLNPVSDSVSVPQRAVSPWFGAVSGQLTCRVLKWHKSLWIWIVRREIFSFRPRNPSETLWTNMGWLS